MTRATETTNIISKHLPGECLLGTQFVVVSNIYVVLLHASRTRLSDLLILCLYVISEGLDLKSVASREPRDFAGSQGLSSTFTRSTAVERRHRRSSLGILLYTSHWQILSFCVTGVTNAKTASF